MDNIEMIILVYLATLYSHCFAKQDVESDLESLTWEIQFVANYDKLDLSDVPSISWTFCSRAELELCYWRQCSSIPWSHSFSCFTKHFQHRLTSPANGWLLSISDFHYAVLSHFQMNLYQLFMQQQRLGFYPPCLHHSTTIPGRGRWDKVA